MNATDPLDGLLAQLKKNEIENSKRFKLAGYTGALKIVSCGKCGLRESIIFWTPEGKRPQDLKFSCPRCTKTHIDFNDESEEEKPARKPIIPPMLVEWVVVPVVLYFVAGFAMGTPPGGAFASELWRNSQAHFASMVTALADT